ncbi:MAG TPA: hypothetical protein VFW71_06230, partial [Actinomycetota bacterium]|nr:hypothetical protein [Actinomycetota bacterium]
MGSAPAASTAPVAGGAPIAQDTFAGRTVSGSWGAASDGQSWALRSGSGASFSVGASGGVMAGTASSSPNYLTLGSGSATNVEAVAEFSTGDAAADDQRIILRFQDAGDFYAAGIASPNNAAELDILKVSGGSLTSLASAPFTATANTQFWVRAQVVASGTSAVLSLRAWADGTTEPTTWQVTHTDTAPLPGGGVGLDGYDGGAGWTVANFSAGDLSGTPSPPPPTPTPTATNTPTNTPTSTATNTPTVTPTAT